MFGFILADQNTPFAVSLGLMIAIAAAEGVGTLMGLGLSGLIDSLLPDFDVPDVDLPDTDAAAFDASVSGGILHGDFEVAGTGADASAAGQGVFSQILGWLCFGRVPALVILVIFLTGFGLAGYVLQSLVQAVTGWLLPGVVASAGAFAGALPFTRVTALGLSKIMPKDESDAVSRQTFVGKPARITQGTAKRGLPAQARLRDPSGQSHYLLVEPDIDDEELELGADIIIVRQAGSRFTAIRNTNATLTGAGD
ncbi:YqiJ family protein [Roseibium salinum]|uniref:YqiJ family protein n=1 Tax=Roseibium salinum TaxID=1604349 RepID=A0ABT3R2Z5_9HYPH|nr:YqiJ family protein [Roseibium sp. DSM 29163]MCX2723458.1 YqiJ family protein [Roseibium sp. DSM 29163]